MKHVKLIFVSEMNNNKFYNMQENSDGTFTVQYGRVGANPQTDTYPMSKWDTKYKEKTKKGYKDNTELFITETKTIGSGNTIKDFISTRKQSVVNMVKKLQSWAKGSIAENYEVSSESVSQKQVDKAQEVLNNIVAFKLTKSTISEFNKLLLELYTVIPRKMKHIKFHLVDETEDLKERKTKIVTEEQDTLDVMAGQVAMNKNNVVDNTIASTVQHDIISNAGLEIEEITDSKIISMIKTMMGGDSSKFKEAFQVVNTNTQKIYNNHYSKVKNNKTELFWHGSRNENWFSILSTGLKIRPSNAIHSGSMFSDGIYFADRFKKSFGYTSGRNSYYAKGNSNECVLAIFEVHVGKQKEIKKHTSDCYSITHKKLQAEGGYDSVFAMGGYDLVNNEYIVYQECQSTVRYLVVVNA